MASEDQPQPKARKGFAAMSPEMQREIASKGGSAVKPEHRAYSQNRELARAAGQKGGKNVDGSKRGFSANPGLASSAGKKGGAASARARKSTAPENK